MASQLNRWAYLRVVATAALLALLQAAPAHSARQSSPPPPFDPAALPAHDSHQGLLIAADPYLTGERSEQKFGKKSPYSAGLLAIDLYLRNDTDSPLRINLDTMELRLAVPGQPRQHLESLSAEDAAFRIILPNGPAPRGRRGPIPGVGDGKSKAVAKKQDELRKLMLPGDIIGPHNTIHGIVIFDVDGHLEDVRHATLYIPDVNHFGSGEKLFFFEIDMSSATR